MLTFNAKVLVAVIVVLHAPMVLARPAGEWNALSEDALFSVIRTAPGLSGAEARTEAKKLSDKIEKEIKMELGLAAMGNPKIAEFSEEELAGWMEGRRGELLKKTVTTLTANIAKLEAAKLQKERKAKAAKERKAKAVEDEMLRKERVAKAAKERKAKAVEDEMLRKERKAKAAKLRKEREAKALKEKADNFVKWKAKRAEKEKKEKIVGTPEHKALQERIAHAAQEKKERDVAAERAAKKKKEQREEAERAEALKKETAEKEEQQRKMKRKMKPIQKAVAIVAILLIISWTVKHPSSRFMVEYGALYFGPRFLEWFFPPIYEGLVSSCSASSPCFVNEWEFMDASNFLMDWDWAFRQTAGRCYLVVVFIVTLKLASVSYTFIFDEGAEWFSPGFGGKIASAIVVTFILWIFLRILTTVTMGAEVLCADHFGQHAGEHLGGGDFAKVKESHTFIIVFLCVMAIPTLLRHFFAPKKYSKWFMITICSDAGTSTARRGNIQGCCISTPLEDDPGMKPSDPALKPTDLALGTSVAKKLADRVAAAGDWCTTTTFKSEFSASRDFLARAHSSLLSLHNRVVNPSKANGKTSGGRRCCTSTLPFQSVGRIYCKSGPDGVFGIKTVKIAIELVFAHPIKAKGD